MAGAANTNNSDVIKVETAGEFDPPSGVKYVVIHNTGEKDELESKVQSFLEWLIEAEPPAEWAESEQDSAAGFMAGSEDETGKVVLSPENGWNEMLEGVLLEICSRCEFVTVEIEDMHIDPTFRDVYYYHYSRRLFDLSRFCTRLTFFEGVLDRAGNPRGQFGTVEPIGSCVITPLSTEKIGRTLLDPAYVIEKDAMVRLSEFETTPHGKKILVRAFPFRSQDGVVTSCAEITALNMLCYYSNEYHDYPVTLPSTILGIAQQYSHERVTPTRGMTYYGLSRILSERGFFPRLHNVNAMPSIAYSGYDREAMFRHMLHWYVSSGIPVAVNTSSGAGNEEGHSLICIGYVPARMTVDEMRAAAEPCAYQLFSQDADKNDAMSCSLLHSADFEREYVVVDDGQMPYSIRDYDQLSQHPRMTNENYVVALHKGMNLDALAAHEAFIAILSHRKIGLLRWAKGAVKEGSEVVMRMFMASSRRYKRIRVETTRSEVISQLYSNIAFPHFVWVAELYLLEDYAENKPAFGEIVLDGTAGGILDSVQTIVLMRYPDRFLFREPGFTPEVLGMNVTPAGNEPWSDEENEIIPFDGNLELVRSRAAI